MTNKQSATDGRLGDAEIRWLAQRANGGFGLVITGGWAIAPEGRVWSGQAALYADRFLPNLAFLAKTIAESDSLVIVQLIHGGARNSPQITGGEGVSASAGDTWRAADAQDISRLVEAHRRAAMRVQRAGLSGVEIHAAHGYLPAQFLSDTQNRRTDEWGGDIAGRSAFLRQIVRAIRAATGPDFIVGVRLSADDPKHGIHLPETARVAGWLAEDGADYIHLSLPDARTRSVRIGDRPVDVVRAAVPDHVRLIVAGHIWTPEEAGAVLDRGADFVALGQASIYNPDWPIQARTPGWAPKRPPFTPTELAAVGVTAPFLDYLRAGWPDAVADAKAP